MSQTLLPLHRNLNLRVIYRSIRKLFQQIDRLLGRVANKWSDPDFIHFDSGALWFYAACLFCFLVGTLADLNGSSIGIYGSTYHLGAKETAIIGAPREVRIDEWVYETPAILNQALKSHSFRVRHSATGDHRTALIANLPVLDFTTLFRPQFWSFFVLPLDYAFAA